jgi:hypothetical protein
MKDEKHGSVSPVRKGSSRVFMDMPMTRDVNVKRNTNNNKNSNSRVASVDPLIVVRKTTTKTGVEKKTRGTAAGTKGIGGTLEEKQAINPSTIDEEDPDSPSLASDSIDSDQLGRTFDVERGALMLLSIVLGIVIIIACYTLVGVITERSGDTGGAGMQKNHSRQLFEPNSHPTSF